MLQFELELLLQEHPPSKTSSNLVVSKQKPSYRDTETISYSFSTEKIF